MTLDEWQSIAPRLAAAWPDHPMTDERIGVYHEVLRDLDAELVEEAVALLLREGRETQPSPGVIRSNALKLKRGRAKAPPVIGQMPGSGVPSPLPIGALTDVDAPPPDTPRARFNRLALVGLLVPLLFGLLPWSVSAGMSAEEARPAPEALVLGGIGLWLGIVGLRRARAGTHRNHGLSVSAIVVSALALLVGLGSLGQILERSEDRRAVAEALGANDESISREDLERLESLRPPLSIWNRAAAAVAEGYGTAVNGTLEDTERWLSDSGTNLGQLRASYKEMNAILLAIDDDGMAESLRPLVQSYGTQTSLIGRLYGAVRSSNVERETDARVALASAGQDHARLANDLQRRIRLAAE